MNFSHSGTSIGNLVTDGPPNSAKNALVYSGRFRRIHCLRQRPIPRNADVASEVRGEAWKMVALFYSIIGFTIKYIRDYI